MTVEELTKEIERYQVMLAGTSRIIVKQQEVLGFIFTGEPVNKDELQVKLDELTELFKQEADHLDELINAVEKEDNV